MRSPRKRSGIVLGDWSPSGATVTWIACDEDATSANRSNGWHLHPAVLSILLLFTGTNI